MEKHFCWLFLLTCGDVLHCIPTLLPGILYKVQDVPAQVVSRSSPCSATCGLGTRLQELCWLGSDGKYHDCQERQVPCVLSWHCSLDIKTVEEGSRVELDCLGVLKLSRVQYRYIFSWRFARGLITMDDSLFERWRAPRISRIILDPVRESDAGTYWCDLQDANYKIVQRLYFGLKVLPKRWMNLNYTDVVAQWTKVDGAPSNDTGEQPLYSSMTMKVVAIYSLSISSVLALLTLLVLYWLCWAKRCTGVLPTFISRHSLGTLTSDYNSETSPSP